MKKIKSGYRDCYRLLALSFLNLEDYAQMQKVALKGIALGFEKQDLFFSLGGEAAYHLKEYPKAIYFFQQAIKINPELPNAYYYLGLTLKELGNQDQYKRILAKAAFLKQEKGQMRAEAAEISLRIF